MQLVVTALLFALTVFQAHSQSVCIWSDCGATSCNDIVGFQHQWSTGSCGHSITPCDNGEQRLYCCQEPNPYTRIYWGNSCTASCNDCEGNDACIIPSNACGDQDKCTFGGRALCGKTKTQETLQNGGQRSTSGLSWYYILLIVLGAGGLVTAGAIAIFVPILCCNGCNCCNCAPASTSNDMNLNFDHSTYHYPT